MRLIRIGKDGSLSFEAFFNQDRPPYAILSHRWGSAETTYSDFLNGKGHTTTKLAGCAAQALRQDLEYMWVDTCCIDKSSSSELTEAINSMYAWYAASAVCYVFMDDVTGNDLAGSLWFLRGWTLQELIAPTQVDFFDCQWTPIGNKQTRLTELSAITGISSQTLEGWTPLRESVATRMKWASNRVTTRIEDTAYCLMGLFDVNMPLLYGEGDKAFRRLQEEIIRQTNDCTIFAWKQDNELGPPWHGPMAASPSDFGSYTWLGCFGEYAPPAIENTSIRVDVLLRPLENQPGVFYGILDCISSEDNFASILLLQLDQARWGSQKGQKHFLRVAPGQVEFLKIPTMAEDWAEVENISIQTLSAFTVHAHKPTLSLELSVFGITPKEVWSEGLCAEYDADTHNLLVPARQGVQAAVLYEFSNEAKLLLLGLNRYGRPCCLVTDHVKGLPLELAMKHTSREVGDEWPSSAEFRGLSAYCSLFCRDRKVVFRVNVTKHVAEAPSA